jgi:PIN domain nuclease of toxin-antitoxin system
MRLLLDTCAFLWFITDDPALSDAALNSISKPDNEVLLSIVSAWEIALKYRAGKLDLDAPPHMIVPEELRKNRIGVLLIDMQEALETASLPLYHRDPFDRLLAVQCLSNDVPTVSNDVAFDPYGVNRVW